MKSLRWTAEAQEDLFEIGRYIARDNPRARQAARFPLAGRRVPEIGQENIREILERGYRIVYWIGETEIQILTVFEGHRLLEVMAIEAYLDERSDSD